MRASSAVLLIAVATSACSRVELGYNWLDWLLEYEAERYLDLDGQNERDAEQAIAAYLAWHRRAMLPRYAELLRHVADAQRQGSFDAAAFEHSWAELDRLYDATLRPLARPLGALLAGLDAEQRRHFEERLRERQEELEEEERERDPNKQRQKTFERFEDLVGELTAEQRAGIDAHRRALAKDDGRWLAERARRNQTLLAMLHRGASADALGDFLAAWWTGELEPLAPDYAAYQQRFWHETTAMVRELMTSLTAKQRRHFADELSGYAASFERLAQSREAGL